ncbi:MAG TPA: 3-oxoacyl-[acyl-carrier-protein] reductase [Sedimentibacter sp.]|jgi:3-oxoacyl-[acyl-carrier protein] reductase|nr:3-oxoacyl-[acyl-carrier-protein] reductase [Sedimentibacter sp.]NLA14622.1 3-oxoacyl-[acyl-carrier-protein] reductase [Tissierellia bacterium]HOA19749.1 3-oxoacyl-[acyl-carrier-protein] reductase [Sedimentibacter sp.]HOT21206.1 3-oxoacyl-[acyl-carrier-protein] reductase [Sedimentibacter sp.]HQO71832.1 3-oxoacyl-[acyl-carrier-protein] reductase [Sedimentibacter sp.]
MKTAIITGASKGIGAVIAKRLNELNYNLVLNYRSNTALIEELIDNFTNKDTNNIIVKCDISLYEDAKKLIDEAYNNFGTVDVLINNAGITKDNILPLMTEEEFDEVIDINLKGTFNCCKHIARRMIKQKYGRIINISSVVGLSGNAGQVNYAASKAGVIGMTKSMARELGKKNILVNAVAPGFIKTEMTDKIPEDIKAVMLKNIPLQRLGQPEDIADCVEFLISDKASYITGQVISVNGGFYM